MYTIGIINILLNIPIQSDVWGPSPTKTLSGKSYYISFTDNKTHYTCTYLLAHKGEVLQAYLTFKAWSGTQHSAKIKVLHSNHGGKYLSWKFSDHLASQGTVLRLTFHDSPHKNGVAERLNRTLLEWVHAMLHTSRLPDRLWGEALQHTVWLKNQLSTKALRDITPYEILTKSKPCLADQHVWGQKVWVHNPNNSKLGRRAKEGQWMGFDTESCAS